MTIHALCYGNFFVRGRVRRIVMSIVKHLDFLNAWFFFFKKVEFVVYLNIQDREVQCCSCCSYGSCKEKHEKRIRYSLIREYSPTHFCLLEFAINVNWVSCSKRPLLIDQSHKIYVRVKENFSFLTIARKEKDTQNHHNNDDTCKNDSQDSSNYGLMMPLRATIKATVAINSSKNCILIIMDK